MYWAPFSLLAVFFVSRSLPSWPCLLDQGILVMKPVISSEAIGSFNLGQGSAVELSMLIHMMHDVGSRWLQHEGKSCCAIQFGRQQRD